MQQLASFASSLFTRITHWLVIRNGARYVLAGTVGLAALGAVVSSQAAPSPTSTPSALHVSGVSNNHDGWYGGHHRHHFGGYYFGRHHGFDSTWPNASGSGGNGYVYQGRYGYTYQGQNGYVYQGQGGNFAQGGSGY